MKRLWPVALCVAAAFGSTSAAAQTTTPSSSTGTSTPTVIVWYAGLATGVTVVSHAGVPVNGEAGMRVWRQADVSIEAGYFSNITTNKGRASAGTLAAFLQQTQGQPASATVKASAAYAMLNGRWVFESPRRYRPYAMLGVGAAHVSPKTTFVLGGTNIGSSVGQYGVTLGKDLGASSTRPAVSAGVGVVVPYGRWYGDVGYRLTSIMTAGGASHVNRLNIGVGWRF